MPEPTFNSNPDLVVWDVGFEEEVAPELSPIYQAMAEALPRWEAEDQEALRAMGEFVFGPDHYWAVKSYENH